MDEVTTNPLANKTKFNGRNVELELLERESTSVLDGFRTSDYYPTRSSNFTLENYYYSDPKAALRSPAGAAGRPTVGYSTNGNSPQAAGNINIRSTQSGDINIRYTEHVANNVVHKQGHDIRPTVMMRRTTAKGTIGHGDGDGGQLVGMNTYHNVVFQVAVPDSELEYFETCWLPDIGEVLSNWQGFVHRSIHLIRKENGKNMFAIILAFQDLASFRAWETSSELEVFRHELDDRDIKRVMLAGGKIY